MGEQRIDEKSRALQSARFDNLAIVTILSEAIKDFGSDLRQC